MVELMGSAKQSRASHIRLLLLTLSIAACAGGQSTDDAHPQAPVAPWFAQAPADPGQPPPPPSGPAVSCAPCPAPETSEVALDDRATASTWGFTPQDVIDHLSGVHRGQIQWGDACNDSDCWLIDEGGGCSWDGASFVGTTTEVEVEIRYAEGSMVKTCPGAVPHPECTHWQLQLGFDVSAATTDGVFATSTVLEVVVIPEQAVVVGDLVPASEVSGLLRDVAPAGTQVEWAVDFEASGASFGLYLSAPPASLLDSGKTYLRASVPSDDCSGAPSLTRAAR